ncbi:MAG: alternative ribosome rescue aminoacyl-tRNA hydrolase ArfB [Acidimicrobiia bacterium]|nr:alternative ribosome rescue aminoacyl-tRNA hydrolase ArfB [Acidimicrobiia bacterium]
MSDGLAIDERHVVPDTDLSWKFGPSGGPGGQHANRAHTRAELSFDLGSSPVFAAELRSRMLDKVDHVAGVVTVSVDESRSQWRNRQMARRRLADLLREAMIRPVPRKPTRTPYSARRKRAEEKRKRSETKRMRRPPDVE